MHQHLSVSGHPSQCAAIDGGALEYCLPWDCVKSCGGERRRNAGAMTPEVCREKRAQAETADDRWRAAQSTCSVRRPLCARIAAARARALMRRGSRAFCWSTRCHETNRVGTRQNQLPIASWLPSTGASRRAANVGSISGTTPPGPM